MPCCKISDCAQMSKTIIAVRHFGLGGRESLETAVTVEGSKQILSMRTLPAVTACTLYAAQTVYPPHKLFITGTAH